MDADTDARRSDTTPGGFRWLLVGGGLLLQFSIGAVYAWSIFGGALGNAESWQLSKLEASLPFTVTIGMIFVGSYVGGRLQGARGSSRSSAGSSMPSASCWPASPTAPTTTGC